MKADTPDDLDELFAGLPPEERVTALVLRGLIRETLPGIREKKSYGAPFYFGRRALCYVWPASITWGGKRQGTGVTLGFHRARHFPEPGTLSFGDRKNIGQREYLQPTDIDPAEVIAWLEAAWALDRDQP